MPSLPSTIYNASRPRSISLSDLYDVRCPHCGKLLAKADAAGAHIIRAQGVVVAQVVEGHIVCPRCRAEMVVKVRAPTLPG